MEITAIDVHDDAAVDELMDVLKAGHSIDRPASAPLSGQDFRIGVRQPETTERELLRVARVDGRIVAVLVLAFSLRENLHFSSGDLTVHPDYRRRGMGTALLTEALRLARAERRSVLALGALTTGDWEGARPRPAAGARFLEKHGFSPALTSVNRRLDLEQLDVEQLRRFEAEAVEAATGYEIIAWSGRMPEELLEPTARLNSMFLEEAPIGDLDLEAEVFDAERMRDNMDRMIERGGYMCGVVARPHGSREAVANTVLGGHVDTPEHAHQQITLVDPKHRGRRLGMRTKVENLWQLRREYPAVRWIYTDNAAVNDHMIGINAALGFERVDHLVEYQRKLAD